MFNQYDEIIQDQRREGIVKTALKDSQGVECYLPHHLITHENVESTEVEIVYVGSAKASNSTISLNDCLEAGPSLQRKTWEILFRNRVRSIALSADMKMTFKFEYVFEYESNTNSITIPLDFKQKFLPYPNFIWISKFIRAIFGLIQSPFLLATIKPHLKSKKDKFHEQKKQIEEIKKTLYCNWTRTHNHLVHKRTLNHLAKLVK